jgi:hypothetical protein
MLFVQSACDYYVAARFAMHAQALPLVGILFHHAIERFLKAELLKKRDLSEVEVMRHNLPKLWRAFKADLPAAKLERHDRTISRIHKFEQIRYLTGISKYGTAISAQWSGPPGEVKARGRRPTPKHYVIVVDEIDRLVADVFKVCGRPPANLFGPNPHALEALTRNNAYAKFFTTQTP